MKIGLISVGSIVAQGVRSLSSYLKKHGHEVISIFFAKFEYYNTFSIERFTQIPFQRDILNLLNKCDLIGVSCYSYNSFETVYIIKILKYLNVPIVWGGVHATLCPDDCLNYTDIVCIGEGESALLELIEKLEKGKDIYNTLNFWFRKEDSIISNPVRPLLEMDVIPCPDFSFKDQYIFNGHVIVPQRPEHHREILFYSTSYGCSFKCSFCANLSLQNISNPDNKKKKYTPVIRKKSIEKIIEELLEITSYFKKLKCICFGDDLFLSRSLGEIEKFSFFYKEKIKIPFTCITAPTTVSDKKLKILVSAGLYFVSMGIQTGSERINKEIYNRNISNEKVLKSAKILHKYSERMGYPPSFDFIIENPYETKEDIIETIKLLQKLPKPFGFQTCSLQFFPNTELYNKAVKDGLINDKKEVIEKLNKVDLIGRPLVSKCESFSNDLISLNDVLKLASNFVSENMYGLIPAQFINSFVSENNTFSNLKIKIPYHIEERIKNNKSFSFFNFLGINTKILIHLLKVIAYLTQKNHEIFNQDSQPTITVNEIDYKLFIKSLELYWNEIKDSVNDYLKDCNKVK